MVADKPVSLLPGLRKSSDLPSVRQLADAVSQCVADVCCVPGSRRQPRSAVHCSARARYRLISGACRHAAPARRSRRGRGDNLIRVPVDHGLDLGRHEASPGLDQQFFAEPRLEPAQLRADGRGGEVQFLPGFRQAARADDQPEVGPMLVVESCRDRQQSSFRSKYRRG